MRSNVDLFAEVTAEVLLPGFGLMSSLFGVLHKNTELREQNRQILELLMSGINNIQRKNKGKVTSESMRNLTELSPEIKLALTKLQTEDKDLYDRIIVVWNIVLSHVTIAEGSKEGESLDFKKIITKILKNKDFGKEIITIGTTECLTSIIEEPAKAIVSSIVGGPIAELIVTSATVLGRKK